MQYEIPTTEKCIYIKIFERNKRNIEEAYLNPHCITSTADKTRKSFFGVSEKRDTSTWSFRQGQTQIWYGIDNQLTFLLNNSVTYEIALSCGGLKDKKFHCHYGEEMPAQVMEFFERVCKIEAVLRSQLLFSRNEY